MDQGVIQNLKVHYRKLVLRWRIAEVEAGKDYKMNLLNSLQLLRRALDQVTEVTVKNCFRHAKFIHKELDTGPGAGEDGDFEQEQSGAGKRGMEEAVEEMLDVWLDMEGLEGVEATMDDFLNVDELVETCGALTLDKIVEEVSATNEGVTGDVSESEAMDIEEIELEQPSISRHEAQQHFQFVRQYLEENSANPAILRYSDALDDYFNVDRKKKQNSQKSTIFSRLTINIVN